MLMEYFDAYARNHQPYKSGDWCYEDGCLYLGLERLYRATGDTRWRDHLKRLVDAQIEPGPTLRGYDLPSYNIDNILPGRALLFLYKETQEPTYLTAAHQLANQLKTQPRTRTGNYWHKLRYPWQVWLDGLYMGLPFQIAYGQVTGQTDLIDDALAQMDSALTLTFVPQTGLYAHAADTARNQPWADPDTGLSKAHWARALGWLAMALVEIAQLTEPGQFAPLRARTTALLTEILAHQTAKRPVAAGHRPPRPSRQLRGKLRLGDVRLRAPAGPRLRARHHPAGPVIRPADRPDPAARPGWPFADDGDLPCRGPRHLSKPLSRRLGGLLRV